MKACTKCAKDIPDSAMHCVFCGEKQGADAGTAKTMMGYAGMAEDVLAAAKAEREKQQAAPQAAPAPAAAPASQPAADSARAPTPDPYGTTQPVDPLRRDAQPSAPVAQPAPQQPAPQAPPYGAPSQGAPPQGQQPYPPPQGQQPYPPPQGQQPYPPPQGQQPYPPPQGQQPYPPPQGQQPHGPHQRPPYLASETGTRMNAPVEPWASSLKKMCTVFGALLLVAFVAPWVVIKGTPGFSWDLMDAEQSALKILPILIVLSGAGALALGLSPLAVNARGIGAAVVGAGPLVFLSLGAFSFLSAPNGRGGADFDWRLFGMLIGLLVLAVGFLVRSTYRNAPIGRYICTAAGVLLVLVFVIPSQGHSLAGTAFDALGSRAPTEHKLLSLYMLGPLALGVIGFAAWAPASTGIGAKFWAWCALLWAAVLPLGGLVVALGSARGSVGDNILSALMFAYHFPVSILAWYALGAYGLATLLGKKLEHA